LRKFESISLDGHARERKLRHKVAPSEQDAMASKWQWRFFANAELLDAPVDD
jgi:hypothetical protein